MKRSCRMPVTKKPAGATTKMQKLAEDVGKVTRSWENSQPSAAKPLRKPPPSPKSNDEIFILCASHFDSATPPQDRYLCLLEPKPLTKKT